MSDAAHELSSFLGEHFGAEAAEILMDPPAIDPSLADASAASEAADAAAYAAAQAVQKSDDHLNLDSSASEMETRDTPSKNQDRKAEVSGLEVTATALRAENERLRKAIAALEGGHPTVESLETGEDGNLIAQHTLRELASAAVSEAAFATFESLQQHLEQQAQAQAQEQEQAQAQAQAQAEEQIEPEQTPLDVSAAAAAAAAALTPPSLADVSASDFLHGLVTRITDPALGSVKPELVDPFALTRQALQVEIESVRAAIAEKEAEIAAAKEESKPASSSTPTDRASLEAQFSKNAAAIDNNKKMADVLRDLSLRLEAEVEGLKEEITQRKAELQAVVDETGDEEAAIDAQRSALVEVRSYIEEVLKMWKEKGTLPAAPLPQFPLLLRAAQDPVTGAYNPPPSSLPKKRGRPARSAQKASVVPPALAHLVPDADTVRQREANTPMRRKGIKRSKHELERERQREAEEGEMMRNLVGMGVWARDAGYVEDVPLGNP